MSDVEQRIAKLERSNRVLKSGSLLLIVALGALGFTAMPMDELLLDRLVIGNREGVPRMVIEQTDQLVSLSIEYPDQREGGRPIASFSAGTRAASLELGNMIMVTERYTRDTSMALGAWMMSRDKLTLGSLEEPHVTLGHNDANGYLSLADHEGRLRVEMQVLEPWDMPGVTSGFLMLHSPGDSLMLRVNDAVGIEDTHDD